MYLYVHVNAYTHHCLHLLGKTCINQYSFNISDKREEPKVSTIRRDDSYFSALKIPYPPNSTLWEWECLKLFVSLLVGVFKTLCRRIMILNKVTKSR